MEDIKIPEVVTEEYLNGFKYQDLPKVFEKIGIKEVFKPGTKKAELIAQAVDQASKLKKIKESGAKEEDIATQLEILNQKSSIEKIELEKVELEEKSIKEESNIKALKEKGLSKEDIVKNINIININLKMGIPSQRESLLQKKKYLESLL